ncbi:hypothetical protein D6D27_07678 [Aureobasidium pullulans]|nr:hypothetical protein D6D27_07678 [Aureobasidium pullulans]THZ82392.1 hypothetical protein D6C88_06136 [Aureobasidium pullulans]
MAAMRGENKKIIYGPSRRMDYEMELSAVIGKPLPYGQTVTAENAGEHIFGFVMLNDWSARDIQILEMIPLGPLNSKNSGTTLSPWIITYDALEPFRVNGPGWKHTLPPHLAVEKDDRGLSIDLSVYVQSTDNDVTRACVANSKVLAWSFEQLLAHQASAGCGFQAGDLLACGTVSEDSDDARGCMLEHNLPPPAVQRGYLADGVVVQFTGRCSEGVGFGDCRAELLPAISTETWTSE